MSHDLSDLNQYTGAIAAGCLFALIICVTALDKIQRTIVLFYQAYTDREHEKARRERIADTPPEFRAPKQPPYS